MAKTYDFLFKVLLVGDTGVGKTCVLSRYAVGAFDSTYISTIGIDFKIKTIELEGKRIKLQIWDTPGREFYHNINTAYYRGAMGIILVYDITSERTFHNIPHWLTDVEMYASPDVERLLIGNKCDREERRAVESERGEQLAWSQGIPFMETSAKTNHNIDEAFEVLVRRKLNLRKPKVCDDCEKGLLEAISPLNTEECDINTLNTDGESFLHIACKNGHLNCVKTLEIFYRYITDFKSTKDAQNSFGDTALHLACYGKSLNIVRILLEMKSSTNIPNKKGETAQNIPLNEDGDCLLHIACQWGDVDIVRYLVSDQRCVLTIQNTYLNTPLHIACYRKNLSIIRFFLKRKCSTIIPNMKGETAQDIPLNEDGDSLLHIACQWGDVDIVRYLITDERCNPNVKNYTSEDTPLHIAVKCGQDDRVVQLLSYKECNPNVQNKRGDTPLHVAAKYGEADTIVQLLSYKECNPNVQNNEGDTPLHIAAKHNMTPAISQLLTIMQCNVQNKDGDTPLHLAASSSKTAVISKLLAHQQYDINAQNKKGNTPLHLACYKRSLDVVKVLLTKRCSTNISNKKGETAQDIPLNEDGDSLLHIACQWGDVDIVRYLITDERCNPNVKNYTSEDTPLHIAVKCGQDDRVVQLLSYKECNPNVQNKEGDTPLHIAAKHNMSTPAISQLLANMQCNVQNKKGDTALHTACYSKSLDSIKLLLTKRCSTNIPNKKGETAQDIPLNEDGDCLLHIACQWGDVDIVRYLITDEECNPNVQSSTSENTPLHIASKRKSLGIIKFLLEMRCSTNIPNKKGETAQDIPLNEDGDCLLHIACQWGDVDIVRYLITDERCNPNVQSYTSKNTPLHIAAKYGQDDTIVQLLSYKECNPNAQNKEGDTPLHFAVRQSKSAAIFQLLAHQQCNPNVQNKEGDTPLHIACCQKSLHIIKLLLGGKCSTNVSNKKGETAQDIPLNGDGDCLLHIACQWGDVDIVKYLITDERFNPNIQSSTSENTPLHIAAVYGHDNTIAKLLSYKECDPNVQNEEGDTCLHVAVRQSRTTAISQLLAHLKCDPNVQNKVGDTPLHIAVWFGHDNTIVELLSCKKCNPNVQNNEGDTPLHIIVKTDKLNRCVLMITDTRCNVNILNNDHLTPLLIAIKHNNATIATALLQYKCDATLCDSHGNTPLHRACIGGETHPEMVEVAKQLLTLTGVDPSCVNNAGQTPIELTTNYQLIQAISHIVKCKTKQSVQTYINMFVVGNPETGKSTLVKAICKEATSVLWRIIPKKVRRVKNVPLHTAGIIPTTFRSKTFGNTVLYDLAGQVEYYTSHAAVIQSTVISTPPAFIVVVNLSESDEKISQTLRYWWSFIDNHAARSSSPPQVILVGSHADVVKLTGRNAQEKMTNISALLEKLSASFHFAGQVALDCRDPASRELQHFCSLVIQSCTVLRQKADVDLRCHVLYAFLLDRFKGKVTCTISDVATSVKENRELLPQDSTSLIPLISTLSDRGLLFLVKGGENHGNWWIILQKESLFGEINGVVFAPKDFSQHKDLSWSTGVVPFSKLKTEFPDYNQNMVSEFLIHLEFCFKIEDHQTLALLKNEATNVEDTSPDASEDYYFFPALVSVENPLHVWEENDAMCCECGWLYKCIRHDQFLTTQFLHVLILRLAFTFALKLNPGDCREDSLALRRKCSVWKHGIAWLNGTPIETVVEVGLQYQSVIVMMRYPKGKEVECIQLRSEIIQKTLEAKDKHCKAVEMSESFLHPTNVKYPLTDNIEDVKFYSLTEIGRVTVKREENALDQRGRNPIPVEDLLLFDPYSSDTSTELLRELFGRTHTMDETVRRQVLETLNKPPTITSHPQEMKDVVPGNPVTFTVHATGTEPLKYQWQWKPAAEAEGLNEEWQPCDTESTSLTIPSVHESNEGSYRCVVSNIAGTQTSEPAKLSIAKPPRITSHPQEMKDAVLGNPVTFTVQATGTDPLCYKWQWKPAAEAEGLSEEWQPCDAVSTLLTIPSVHESNEGSYRCVVSNIAGTQTSEPAKLSIAKPPGITSHPQEMKDAIPGELVKFTVHATGTDPLKYQWQWKPAAEEEDGSEEWWPCDVEKSDSASLAIASVQKSNEGNYRCVIGNFIGSVTSDPAKLSIGTKPTLPELLKFNCTSGRVVNIPVQIATKYNQFGVFLLIDSTGSRIETMAHKHLNDAERINIEILKEWLTGRGKQPVTWATLVEVLRDIELSALAGEIEAVKCQAEPKT